MKAVMLTVLLAGAACTSVRSSQMGEKQYPPKPDDFEIAVFQEKRKPSAEKAYGGPFPLKKDIKRPFKVIATMRSGGAPAASEMRVLRNAQQRARELGADAIVLTDFGWGTRSDGHRQPIIMAEALRYTESWDE